MNDSYSFIPSAFNSLTERKGQRGAIARAIEEAPGNTFEDKFLEIVCLNAADDTPFHYLAVISFLQPLMDKVSWNARKLFNGNLGEDSGNGYDPAAFASEAVGVVASNEEISQIVDADYGALDLLSTMACQICGMGEQDGSPSMAFYYFAPTSKVGDDWVTDYSCTSFDDAFSAMDEIAEKLNKPTEESARARLEQMKKAA